MQKKRIRVPVPRSVGHDNLCPIFGVLDSDAALFVVAPLRPYSVQHLLQHRGDQLAESHAKPLFLIYQVLLGLRHLHSRGAIHGRLNPANVLVDRSLWIELAGVRGYIQPQSGITGLPDLQAPPSIERLWLERTALAEQSFAALLHSWIHGWTSNFEYLMALNTFAGRRISDPAHHPILPWGPSLTSYPSPSAAFTAHHPGLRRRHK